MLDELKQVIVVNGWLDMPAGKLAAQVSHASMAFLTNALRQSKDRTEPFNEVLIETLGEETLNDWLLGDSFTKLILVARTPEEWEDVKRRLVKYDLADFRDYIQIIDQGRTCFDGVPTHTCTGFRPMRNSIIKKIFGNLPLQK